MHQYFPHTSSMVDDCHFHRPAGRVSLAPHRPNRSSTLALAVLLISLVGFQIPQQAAGQDQRAAQWSSPVFSTPEEYDQFMGNLKRAAYGPDGGPELQAMVPMLNDIALNKPIGSTASQYGIEATPLDLLADPDVRGELEMVDEQYESLQKMNAEIQRQMGERIRRLDFSRPDKLLAVIRSIRQDGDRQLESLLLPHQLERLREMQVRNQLKRHGLVDVLAREPWRTELELSDEQIRNLRDTEREIEQQLERDIARLRKRARDKLISQLEPRQRQRVQKLFGDALDGSAGDARRRPGREAKGSRDGSRQR